MAPKDVDEEVGKPSKAFRSIRYITETVTLMTGLR